MARHVATIATLRIASGQSASAAISSATMNTKTALGHIVDLLIYSPAALTGTITVETSWLESPGASDWRTLNVSGTDVAVGAGKAVLVSVAAMRALRLKSSGSEASDRDFVIVGQYDI